MTFHDPDMAKGGNVVLLTGPFGDPERVIALDRPMAVAEIIAVHELAFGAPTIAIMDGEPVLRGEWAVRMVRPQDTLAFVAVPRGGGNGGTKQIVGLVAAIALSIAAPFVGGFVAGALGLTGTALTVGSSLASIAFLAGGSLLLNAIMPQASSPASSSDKAGSVYSVAAASNTADPLGIIPVPYGTFRFPPRYASRPYAEYSGNDQYLYQLFCLSPGKWVPSKIEFGGTEAWNSTDGYSTTFSDLTFQFVYPGDSITLFPANVETSVDVSGQQVPDPPSVLGPFVVNAAGTTINRIAVDFAFPAGLFAADSGGMGVASNSIPLRAEYQQIDDSGTPIGGWSDVFRETITFATRTPQRLTRKVDVAAARYQVRFSAEAAFDGTDGTSVNQCIWAGLRGYLTGFVTPANCTLLAMRVKANEQLSSAAASQINVTGTRWLPVWDGTSWSAPQATRSIAWAAADLLRNTDYGLGLADTQFDLARLLALDATWTGRGDTFNGIFDTAQVARDALMALLRVGRTQAVRMAGRIGFVRLESKSLKRAMFTPRNVVRGSFQHKLVLFDDAAPDSVNASYLDATVWDTRQVLASIDTIGGNDPQAVDFFGITDHDQAWREGVTLAAINAYQREFVSFTAEWEGKLLVRGDPILVEHPFIEGVAQAAVTSQVGGTLTVDRDLTPPSGDGYVILRDVIGQEWGPCLISSIVGRVITLDPTDLATVEANMGTLGDLLPGDREEPAHLLLCDGATRPFNGLVVTATPDSSGKVAILAVIDAPEVYAADGTNTMPSPWGVPTLPPAINPLPVIYELTGMLRAAVGGLELDAMWLPAAGASSYVAHVSYDAGVTWVPVYAGAANRFTAPINPQAPKLRVAGINNGTQGPWTTVTFTTANLPAGGGYIGSASLQDEAVRLRKLGQDITALVAYFGTAIADLQDAVGQIGAVLDANDLSSYLDKQTLTNKVTSQVGSAMAIAGQLFEAASSDIAAEATARTAAIAAMGSAFAGGLLEFDSAVTGSGAGATATIAAKIRAQVGDAVAQGGWMWKATADGAGHTTVQALLQQDTLYLVDGAGNIKTAITFDLTTGTIIGASLSLGSGAVNIDATGITIGSHVSISATGALTLSA